MQENLLNLNKSSDNLWHLNQDLLLPAPVQNDDRSTPGMCRWEHKVPFLSSSQLNVQLPTFLMSLPTVALCCRNSIVSKSTWDVWGSLPSSNPYSWRESSTPCMAEQEYWALVALVPVCLCSGASTPREVSQKNQLWSSDTGILPRGRDVQ